MSFGIFQTWISIMAVVSIKEGMFLILINLSLNKLNLTLEN